MATGRIGTTPALGFRWSIEPAGGTTSLSGLDNNSVGLSYTPGNERVYRNGVLLSRVNDYTATSGNSITLNDATVAGDIIEVFSQDLTQLADTIARSTLTAKGQVLTATAASTPAVLAVGANGTVLTADSAETTGLKWATPAAGGLTQLATQNMAGLNTVTFSSINQGYRALVIQGTGLYLGSAVEVRLRWNNISTAVYDYTGLGTNSGTGQNNLDVTYVTLGDTATSTASTHNFWAEIVNYNVDNQLKLVRGLYSQPPDSRIRMFVATGASSGSAVEDAITEINISTTTNFTAGTITLYGMS